MEDTYDVAIVGYGPTGLVAASMLGQAGHRVVVLERWPSPYGLPRLTHIDDETARAVQAAGDADEALRDSCPTEYLWVNGADETLLNIPAAAVGTQGFPTHISIYQPDIEDSVERRVRTLPGVTVRRGCNVVGLGQDDDAVTLTTVPWRGEGEPASQVRARYVIAADGSKSTVRTLLGTGREDLGFNERWLNIDTEWKRPVPEAFRTTKQYCDPHRGHMYMIIGEKRQRFELALLAAQDPRVAACVVNGAPPAPEVPEFRTAREQMEAAFGTRDRDTLAAMLEQLRFDPSRQRIGCPLLVLHGGADPLVDQAQAQAFAGASARGRLESWADGEHTIYNHAGERDALVGDWLADSLGARRLISLASPPGSLGC